MSSCLKSWIFKLLYIFRHRNMSDACNKKESKMAINVDNLSYAQAREYYMSYLSGNDDTGIGAQIDKSTKWHKCLDDWKLEHSSDSTDYDIDNKNLKGGAATASLGLGAGSAIGNMFANNLSTTNVPKVENQNKHIKI